MKLLDIWTHGNGKFTRHMRMRKANACYWMHGKFLECTENLLDCTVNLLDAWLSRVRALSAYMSCTAQTVGQSKKQSTLLSQSDCRDSLIIQD